MEEYRQSGQEPLMYSQFCYYIQQDERKRRATMHIKRKPAEQVEVDWAGDPAKLTVPDTGEIVDDYIFVGVMTYSQYAYVEAFPDEKQQSWIDTYVHMYKYFGGVAKILVLDNCKEEFFQISHTISEPISTPTPFTVQHRIVLPEYYHSHLKIPETRINTGFRHPPSVTQTR